MSGYIEIIPGWDSANPFAVMDWAANGDSGWCAGSFRTRPEAVKFAQSYSAETGREIITAVILPFSGGVAA